jgi:hypothetical protein
VLLHLTNQPALARLHAPHGVLLRLAALAVAGAVAGGCQDTCLTGEQEFLERMRRFEAANRRCAADEDCVVVGFLRQTCECQEDLFLTVSRSAEEKAERWIERAEACGYVWRICDDYNLIGGVRCIERTCVLDSSHASCF